MKSVASATVEKSRYQPSLTRRTSNLERSGGLEGRPKFMWPPRGPLTLKAWQDSGNQNLTAGEMMNILEETSVGKG